MTIERAKEKKLAGLKIRLALSHLLAEDSIEEAPFLLSEDLHLSNS